MGLLTNSDEDGKLRCAIAPRTGEPCRLFHQAFCWYAPSRGKTLVSTREAFSSVPTRVAAPSTLIGCVEILANSYIKSVPLPRLTARVAHVEAVTVRCQALTLVPYGMASVPLLSPMTKHRFSHESESFVQPLIMRQVTCHTHQAYTYLEYNILYSLIS